MTRREALLIAGISVAVRVVVVTDALFVFFSGATLCATIVALVTRRRAWAIVVGLTLMGALLARRQDLPSPLRSFWLRAS